MVKRAPAPTSAKTMTYYANVNPDLLRWMPLAARDVLELGCGEGALAAAYKRRNPHARYTAIESHPAAAAVARGRVDRLIEADATAMDADAYEALGTFDAIIMGDVLEHLADPWAMLAQLGARLRPHGWLALSVPNAAHWTVLAALMNGSWPARDSGLFDRTHLRWFTLESLRTLLAESGFEAIRARPRNFVLDAEAAERWIPTLGDAAGRLGMDRRAFEQRSKALQWVVNARSADTPAPERLHVHFAAITPDFLDARMRLPAEALSSDPSLDITYAEKTAQLPKLAADKPKVAVVQRLALASPEAVRRYVGEAAAAGWVTVFEMDDHPELIGRIQRSSVGAQLEWTLRGFHAVQTSTEALGRIFAAFGTEVAVFPNAMLELPATPPADEERADDGRPLRVFHGALNREGFTSGVAAALGEVAARRDVEFAVVHDRAFFDALPTAAKTFHPALNYRDYLARMAECDIVLSPLEGEPAELFKSDIKFLEAAANRCAMIASPPVYAEVIADGRTGLIAPALDDWPVQLARLLDDQMLRREIAEAAYAYVAELRMMASQVERRGAWYRRLWRDRDRLTAAAQQRAAREALA